MMLKFILLLAVVACSSAQEHTTLDDNHDMESAVNNPDTLLAYVNCFIKKGPCTELTESFRKHMPEAVPEACARCNDAQKHIFRIFLDGLEKNNPQKFKEYCEFYDPKGDRMGPLRAVLSKY